MEELQTQPHPSLRSTHQGRVAARKILFAAPSTSQSNGTTPKGTTSFGGGRLSRRGDGAITMSPQLCPDVACFTSCQRHYLQLYTDVHKHFSAI
jgi:hypothetical protein